MNRRMRIVIALVMAVIFISGISLGVYGTGRTINAKITYDNIKIVIDDMTKTPSEQPFIMNGRVYVPLRFIGEAMNKPVTWDGASKTAYIGGKGYKSILMTNIPNKLVSGSENYVYSQRLEIAGYSFDVKSSTAEGATAVADYDVKGLAKTLKATVSVTTNFTNSGKFKVTILDQNDKVLNEVPAISSGDPAKKLEFDIQGVNTVRVKVEALDATSGTQARVTISDFSVLSKDF